MDKLEEYIFKLEEIISDTKKREKNVINFVSDVMQNEETVYNVEIDGILSDFALDIDDYEPDPVERKAEPYYFGDEELLEKVNNLLRILKNLKNGNQTQR